jgi:hypothetical protein
MVDNNSGPTPVVQDDANRGAIEQLVMSRIEAAFNNLQLPPRPARPVVDDRRDADSAELAPDAQAGGSTSGVDSNAAGDGQASEDGDQNSVATSNRPAGAQRPSVGWADGGGGGAGYSDDSDGSRDSIADGTGPQALNKRG